MIGGDASYDHEGGVPAEGTPPHPVVPESPPAARAWPVPPEPGESIAQDAGNAGNADNVRIAGPDGPPSPEPTGDERVDAAMTRFEALTAVPVADHVEIFEDVQRRLQDVLASVDNEETPEAASGQPSGAAPPPQSWGS
jgi:hypothetical protein